MKKRKQRISFTLYERIEKLPWFCTFVLGLSCFIFFVMAGIAIGVLWQKDKIMQIRSLITKQADDEEARIDAIIKSYRFKTVTPEKNATCPSPQGN